MHSLRTWLIGNPAIHALLAVAFLALVPGLAVAQPQDGQVFQDWIVRCQKSPQNAAVEICSINTVTRAKVNDETQRAVMQIAVAYIGDDPAPLAVVTVPLFVRLPPGVRFQIDNGQAMTLPFEICNPEGCKARLPLDAPTMSAFKAGVGGKVAIQVPPGNEVEIPFSLKGFSAALAALK